MTIDEINEKLVLCNCLSSLKLEISPQGMSYSVFLDLREIIGMAGSSIQLHFEDVSRLRVAEFGDGLVQLMHSKISESDSGWDRSRYRFEDLENNLIYFDFAKLPNATAT